MTRVEVRKKDDRKRNKNYDAIRMIDICLSFEVLQLNEINDNIQAQ